MDDDLRPKTAGIFCITLRPVRAWWQLAQQSGH